MGQGAMILVFLMLSFKLAFAFSRKTSISALLTMPKPLTVWITTNWKILKEMEISDHFTCLLRNLYAVQEATVRTGYENNEYCNTQKNTEIRVASSLNVISTYY